MQKPFTQGLRSLGALEHLFWLLDRSRPIHFAIAAEVEGSASEEEWRSALDRVQARHPLLSATIVADPGSAPRFRAVAAGPIPLRMLDGELEWLWQDVVGEELAMPFEGGAAPLMRAAVISGPNRASLILLAHHALADGMGLAFVIRDTLAALAGNALVALPLAPSMDALVGAEHGATPSPPRAAASVPLRPLAPPKVRGLRLPRELAERVRDRARREGATVHAALMTALSIAGRQIEPRWREIAVRLLSPINVRTSLGLGDDLGVYVTGATSVFAKDEGAGRFWHLARAAGESVAKVRSRESAAPVIGNLRKFLATGPDAAAAASFAAQAFVREGVLTNLGALPFPTAYGRFRLDAVWGPAGLSGLSGDEQTIGVATVNGALCLTHSGRTQLPGLLEAMHEVLARESA